MSHKLSFFRDWPNAAGIGDGRYVVVALAKSNVLRDASGLKERGFDGTPPSDCRVAVAWLLILR